MSSKESLECICNICDHDCCPYIHYDKSRCVFYGLIKQDLDQLEEYRKIEEEIGIDLITLFKALKDGIYINEDGSVYKDCIKSIEHWSDGWGFISNDDCIEVLFKDYGKTWALTEEELENEHKNI